MTVYIVVGRTHEDTYIDNVYEKPEDAYRRQDRLTSLGGTSLRDVGFYGPDTSLTFETLTREVK